MKKVKMVREKSGNLRKKESQGKSGNFDRLSGPERSCTPQAQLDDLNFFQNAISTSQGKFCEVREKWKVRENVDRKKGPVTLF